MPLLQCNACQKLWTLPKYVCSHCGGIDFIQVGVTGTGTVFSYTTIRVAPEKYAGEAPYHIGLIQLTAGVRITARVTVPEGRSLDVGLPVQLVETGTYGFRFEVV
ncbi:MAG: Zn-ribbon domain-containing OB-fold protein [Bacillota bacterium]